MTPVVMERIHGEEASSGTPCKSLGLPQISGRRSIAEFFGEGE